MTPQDRINAIRFGVNALEAKLGSHDPDVLRVALVDLQRAADHWQALTIELARRYERAGGR